MPGRRETIDIGFLQDDQVIALLQSLVGSGLVNSVTAGDSTIVIGGSAINPTVRVGLILNANVDPAAAIAKAKLAPLAIVDADVSAISEAKITNLVADLAARITNPMTAQDDLVLGGISGAPARLPKGTGGQVLTTNSGTGHVDWETPSAGFTNPMTSPNDLILGGAAGAPTRLAKGADTQVLTVDPTTHNVQWDTPSSGFVNPMTTQDDLIVGGAGGAATRLGKGASATVLTVDAVSGHLAWDTVPPANAVDPAISWSQINP